MATKDKKRRIFANLPSCDGPSCYIGDTVDEAMHGLNNVLPDEIRILLEDDLDFRHSIEISVEEMTDEEVANLPDIP